MSDATIYGGLSLTIPEGFHVMDGAELKRAYMDDNKDRWGIADKDRHIMVAVFWHESGALVSALGDSKSVARSNEKRISRGLKAHGYSLERFLETEIAGNKAHGFRHALRIQDEDSVSEVISVKNGRVCYTFYYYSPKTLDEDNHRVFESILDSVKLS